MLFNGILQMPLKGYSALNLTPVRSVVTQHVSKKLGREKQVAGKVSDKTGKKLAIGQQWLDIKRASCQLYL